MAETRETKTASEHDLREARKVVNRIILSRIVSEVGADPVADLTDLLDTQLKVYPGLVKTLAQSVRARSPGPIDAGDTRSSDSDQETQPAAESISVSSKLPLEIVYPLTSRLLDIVFEGREVRAADDSLGFLSEDLVAALNHRLAVAECPHKLLCNFVLGFGPLVTAKVGPSLDVDHVSNLQYVNARAPDTPILQCLGAFRNGHRSYFFLSRAPGVTLESIWPVLTASHKLSVRNQLNSVFRALCAQTPDAQGDQLRLGSFETGICKDTRRIQHVSEKPIRTEAEFNDFLCHVPGEQ